MQNVLLLASKSPSRHMLLSDSKIPFAVINQEADESVCDWNLPLQEVVEAIARYKMQHAVMPQAQEGTLSFVLTADTLSQDSDGTIEGKPVDKADALEKLKKARNGSRLCTAFCLERKIFNNGQWVTQEQILQSVWASYAFVVSDHWLETYIANSISLSVANAIAVEGYGAQFLQSVQGSYSTIVGLPMFELRQALEVIGFFKV